MPKDLERLLEGMVEAGSGRLDRGQLGKEAEWGARLGILPDQGGLLLFPSH